MEGVSHHQGSGTGPLKKSGIRDRTPEKIRDQGIEEKSGTLYFQFCKKNLHLPYFFQLMANIEKSAKVHATL